MSAAKYNPVCEICQGRPKMDRCSCCEECWYGGRYSRAVAQEDNSRRRKLIVSSEGERG